MAITADGRRVVSASYDKTLKVWDLETGALICTFNCEGRLYCAAVAPDGRTFVASGRCGPGVFSSVRESLKGRLTGGSLISQGTPCRTATAPAHTACEGLFLPSVGRPLFGHDGRMTLTPIPIGEIALDRGAYHTARGHQQGRRATQTGDPGAE